MAAFFLGSAVAFAVLQWFARWREIRWLHYATKPGAMLALLLWFWQVGGWTRMAHWGGALPWFGVGLVFSLIGDILLMLPPAYFLAGLGAFLVGHAAYIAGFQAGALTAGPLVWVAGLLALVAAAAMVRYYLAALRKRAALRRIRVGVAIYIVVIFTMIFSAYTTLYRPAWQPVNAMVVLTGALLFGVSDGLLAYNRFVRKVTHAHVWVMMSYHLAQFMILVGAADNFLRIY